MSYTAHVDTFARDNLPPRDQWPDLINLDKLGYPERLNCAAELLDRAVAEGDGDRRVLIAPEGTWTYRDLAARANRVAHVLVNDLGLRPGERVLLHGPNNAMLVAAWFGIVKAGGIVVATMPLLRARELAVMVEKARVRVALFDHRYATEITETRTRAPMLTHAASWGAGGDLESRMAAQPADFTAVPTAADDVCLIGFTSGTTGMPKGTMHFHRDVLAICDTFSQRVLRPKREDLFIGSPPLAFTFGLGGLVLFPMRARAATVLLEKAPPPELAKATQAHRATISFTSPTGYRFMLDNLKDYDLSSLRECVSAGETLPKATSDTWFARTGIRQIDGIGATELLHIFISAAGADIRPGATGKAVPLYEARVIDDDGRPVPPDTVGRLAVRGPTGCRYLADDRQKKYVRDGWNVTGDAYLMDADGYFWFQARTDDMIVSSGYNISGPEVEAALLEHSAIKECAVVAAPDAMRGHIVKAYVVLRDGAPPANPALVEDIQNFVKTIIAPYKYPRAVEFLAALPKTETGKIQRFKLRAGPPGA